MLGAQTRAAEYQAAKKASARQASREAEAQKLPPPSAPISLGAYTRSAQTSRNKGVKTYVPLILEATPEADPEELPDAFETPSRQPPNSDSGSTSNSDPSSIVKPRVMLPLSNHPSTMPRSMQGPGRPSSRGTPIHHAHRQPMPPLQHHSSFPMPHFQHVIYDYGPPDPTFQSHDFGWPHMPLLQQNPYSFENHPHASHQTIPLKNRNPLVAPPQFHNTAPQYQHVGSCRIQSPPLAQPLHIFGPDDMSPAKQEVKMLMRAQVPPEVKTKMQKFEAVQHELSKKGKTVLNSGNLPSASKPSVVQKPTIVHKPVPESPPAIQIPDRQLYVSDSTDTTSIIQDSDRTFAPYAPSTTECPSVAQEPNLIFQPDLYPTAFTERRPFVPEFDVMTDAWFDLEPPTRLYREKMRRVMQSVVKTQYPVHKPVLEKDNTYAQRWQENDPRGFQGARREVDMIARMYSEKARGGIECGDIDVPAGMVRGAGAMLANLIENITDGERGRDYFYQLKPSY